MMLGKRILTALVAAPAAVYVFWQGGVLFAVCMIFLAMASWYEYLQMMKNKAIRTAPIIGGFFVLAIVIAAWIQGLQNISIFLCGAMAVILSMTVLNYSSFTVNDAAYNLLGIFYIGVPFAHFILLRLIPDALGMKLFALAMLGTWACDSVAFFGGTRWGRHKLCPPISPAKSVEGAVFGFFGCVVACLFLGFYLDLSIWSSVFCGGLIGLTCQVGDLVESAIKRYMGVKDSGRFFPGHGGVLDRVDSLLFSIPAAYYYLIYLSGK